MRVTKYNELIIWKLGMKISKEIYSTTRQFPKDELYGLTSQMRRSSISIPSNIAEGFNRFKKRDFIRFLEYAMGSSGELETQILLAHELNFLSKEKKIFIRNLITEEQKMIKAFINKLTTSIKNPTKDYGLSTKDSL